MAHPVKSIRWRFVLWLAFLLTLVLAGFGVTAYQLHSNNQFTQLDEELKNRVAVLSGVLRSPPAQFNRPDREPFRREDSSGPNGTNGSSRLDRPFDGGPPRRFFENGGPGRPPESGEESRFISQKLRQSAEVSRWFDESSPNAFYYAAWTRVFGRTDNPQSTNARPKAR